MLREYFVAQNHETKAGRCLYIINGWSQCQIRRNDRWDQELEKRELPYRNPSPGYWLLVKALAFIL